MINKINFIKNLRIKLFLIALIRFFTFEDWKIKLIELIREGDLFQINYQKRRIYSYSLDIGWEFENNNLFIGGFSALKNLKKSGFVIHPEDRIIISSEGIKFKIESPEDLYILDEIFYKEDYNFDLNVKNKKINIIDIGMHKGYAALYFANMKGINKVYSFEPISITFSKAQLQMDLNPLISKKIIAYNYGLSNYDGEKEFFVNNSILGQSTYNVEMKKDNTLPVKEHVRNAKVVFEEILIAGELFAIKMDCEGAELQILNSIREILKRDEIRMIILEWHIHFESLLDLLKETNFSVSFSRKNHDSGIIKAWKN